MLKTITNVVQMQILSKDKYFITKVYYLKISDISFHDTYESSKPASGNEILLHDLTNQQVYFPIVFINKK